MIPLIIHYHIAEYCSIQKIPLCVSSMLFKHFYSFSATFPTKTCFIGVKVIFTVSSVFVGMPGEKGERGPPGTGLRGQRGPNGPPGKSVGLTWTAFCSC